MNMILVINIMLNTCIRAPKYASKRDNSMSIAIISSYKFLYGLNIIKYNKNVKLTMVVKMV